VTGADKSDNLSILSIVQTGVLRFVVGPAVAGLEALLQE
jgi:hypothetical protein